MSSKREKGIGSHPCVRHGVSDSDFGRKWMVRLGEEPVDI